VARWEPDSRGRLGQAALELFAQRGFDDTTVEAIAARAGVTERTFFRHFADKREVLFAGSGDLESLLVDAVIAAPRTAAPMEAVAAALESTGPFFDERRDFARQRQAVIAANAELRERELIKMATLASALAGALRQRGVNEPAASLAAEAGIAVFRVAFERWITDSKRRDLARVIRESLAQLRAVTADG
jgi:AcrR family transcriptional regulator